MSQPCEDSLSYSDLKEGRDWNRSAELQADEDKHGKHATSLHYAQDLLNFRMTRGNHFDDARAANLLNRALRYFMNRWLSRAWQEWWAKLQELRHQMYIVAGALKRMQNLKLSQAWEQWQFWYEEHKRSQFLLAGAMNRFLKRQLSMAFEKWQYEAQEMKRSAYLLAGAMNRMLKRQLSMAFEKWQYEAAEMKRALYFLSGALKRMQNLKLSQAWEQWQFVAEEARYQAMLLTKAVMKMMKRQLAMAMTRWLDWYDDLLAQKEMLTNIVLRMLKRQLAIAFYTWEGKLAKYYVGLPPPVEVEAAPVVHHAVEALPQRKRQQEHYSAYKPPAKIVEPLRAEGRLGYRLGDLPVPMSKRGLNNPRAILVSQHSLR